MEIDFLHPPSDLKIILELALAMFLGLLVGMERSIANKNAGMRTYALVSLGSCLFISISLSVTSQFIRFDIPFDPMRVAAGIVAGVGFLGAGLIVMKDCSRMHGLTTAAGLWVSAGIGVAVGYGMYTIAIYSTLLMWLIFTLMWVIEEKIKNMARRKDTLAPQADTHND